MPAKSCTPFRQGADGSPGEARHRGSAGVCLHLFGGRFLRYCGSGWSGVHLYAGAGSNQPRSHPVLAARGGGVRSVCRNGILALLSADTLLNCGLDRIAAGPCYANTGRYYSTVITWGPLPRSRCASNSMFSSSRFHNRRDVWHLSAAAAATWRRTSFKCEVCQATQQDSDSPHRQPHYLLDSLAPLKDV